jgi:hypothetical protein
MHAPAMTALGPTLPTWAAPEVGSYLAYTGRDTNVAGNGSP